MKVPGCYKKAFRNRAKAEARVAQLYDAEKSVGVESVTRHIYKCPACGLLHITSNGLFSKKFAYDEEYAAGIRKLRKEVKLKNHRKEEIPEGNFQKIPRRKRKL